MDGTSSRITLCAALALVGAAVPATAQTTDPVFAGWRFSPATVGSRSAGMGGAFVAVADDASATYWNPAGLVTGSVFSAVAEVAQGDFEGAPVPGANPPMTGFAGRGSFLVALGTWPVGATFYRIADATARVIGPGTEAANVVAAAELRRLTTTNVGVNLLHSLWSGVHVGATLKYVHGSAGGDVRLPAPGDPLDAARDLDARGSNQFDVDAGVMVDLRKVKLGLTGRNLAEPEFETAQNASRLQLPRQVRAGVAFRAAETLIVSLDADLTSTPDVTGDRRSLAAGAEQRLWRDRAAVRGGFRISTTGDTRPVVTTGGSLALKSGIFADGYVAVGLDEASPDGFGLGVRLVF